MRCEQTGLEAVHYYGVLLRSHRFLAVDLKINRHILADIKLLFTVYCVQCASESPGLLICPGMRHRALIYPNYLSNFIFSGGLYITNHAIPVSLDKQGSLRLIRPRLYQAINLVFSRPRS